MILNLKLVIMLGYLKYKNIFAKNVLQTGLKKLLWLKKWKVLLHGHMLLLILMLKKLFEHFMKKNCKKKNKKEFRIEKIIKKKGDKLYVKWNGYDNSINSRTDKKGIVNWIYKKLYEPFGGDINVTVDLSNYATKADLKNAAGVDTSSFAKKNLFS